MRREAFAPQPFRQLARVLRDQGDEEAARTIVVAEQWATPKEGTAARLWRFVFGFFFGFGLSWKRAATTVFAWLLLGTSWVALAAHNHILVETPVLAATHVADVSPSEPERAAEVRRVSTRSDLDSPPEDHARVRRVFTRNDRDRWPADHVECTDVATSPVSYIVYALDMMVPFIPLHAETKCERKRSGAATLRSGLRL